jgi:hypothetical protein
VVENRLATRLRPWESLAQSREVYENKLLIRNEGRFYEPSAKTAIENKALIHLVWVEIGEKKGGPKMKVYPVMLMKTQDRFSTAYPQSRQVKQK